MKYSQLFQETVDKLVHAEIEDAQVDAFLIFDFCFSMTRSQLFLHGDHEVPEKKLAGFQNVLERRLSREPLHYITGIREFWSEDFYVSPAVLVPRPETEFLLEHTLSICAKHDFHPKRILDMCTGSGVIAVVLAKEFHAENLIAVDSSIDALDLAAKNRAKFHMADNIHFICANLFSALSNHMQFDLIVSNPPYIATHELDGLQQEVKCWEPRSSLLAGDDGLDIIVRLADNAHRFLCPEGWLFIEIGAAQKEQVEQLFLSHNSGAYEEVKVVPDWAGRPRVLQAKKTGKIHE